MEYQSKPFASREEQLVDHALQATNVPADWLRDMRPIARPQALFPSKVGKRHEWTIGAVLNIDRETPTYRSWQSGMQVQRSTLPDGIEGTTRPSSPMQAG